MPGTLKLIGVLLFNMVFIVSPLFSQFTVSKLFSDHAVLQRDQPIKVWGWADDASPIHVVFNNQSYHTNPKEGAWMVDIPAIGAGGPYDMTIYNITDTFHYSDILIGDVWICSGQSNMEWTVVNSNNAADEIKEADDANIRHFKVPRTYSQQPEVTLAGGEWTVCNSDNVGEFTAVGYYFAKTLRQHVDIPIGLLNTSWGGSRIEPWMSAGTLNMEDPKNAVEEILSKAKADHDAQMDKLKEKFPSLSNIEQGIQNGLAVWADEQLDMSDWQDIDVTETWENQGFEGFDGTAWYRTTFTLTEAEAQNEVVLSLGTIDDNDITWVNGIQVGKTNGWDVQRSYTITPDMLKTGANTIALRVEDTYGGGGMYGESDLLFVQTQTRRITLPQNWKLKLDAVVTTDYLKNANHIPTLLYNKMIYPILNYGITGALWYQGESNGSNATDAEKYADLFQDMISSWRSDFRSGEFAFLYVQLANFLAPKEAGAPTNWAILRASQTEALQLNNTAQAVIIDIGEADDIHPRNKQDVGLRLSLAARKLAYGEDIIYQSPMYTSHEIIDDKVHISFDHVGEGLEVHDRYQYIKGFAIAGADEKFSWAKARLDGHNKVVVWNERIESPKYVIYAWADNPDDVNLYNSANLPATPFRLGY